jgi:hypothetical protein
MGTGSVRRMRDNPVELNAEVLSERGPILRCRVAGHVVDIARTHLRAGSEVAHAGDRGKLVIPLWLGVMSGAMVSERRSQGRV